MTKFARKASEIRIRPACPAQLAAAIAPTSFRRAHSRSAAGPSDTGLAYSEIESRKYVSGKESP
jgi:hypothetical protein